MQVSAQHIFRELEEGKWKSFYVIVGEEPFQAGELGARVKSFFIRDENSATFNYEAWDGEHLDASDLRSSLDTLPGLFDIRGDSLRLVSCSRFEKLSAGALETLDGYFHNPSPTTCFLIFTAKVDKRKSWFKAVDERGYVIEANEPYEREWPKWQSYLERKLGKKLENGVWELLVDSANRTLSVVWSELQKLAVFVGERREITYQDWALLTAGPGTEDVFAFAEDVLCRRSFAAMRRVQNLLHGGENEIKLLSILVRQFRMVDQAQRLTASGITDSKTIASRIGAHPFFVSRILRQTRHHTGESLARAIHLLADCDLRMKTGDGGLFEHFLLPYFASPSS